MLQRHADSVDPSPNAGNTIDVEALVTLSYRTLYGLVAAIAVTRFVLVTLVLPDGSILFSDEITYAELAGTISAGGDWQSAIAGQGATLVPANLALLGPGALVITLGLDPLAAVRLVSIAFAALAQACLVWIVSTVPAAHEEHSARRVRVLSWPMLAISVFVLLPGSLFWNSLGLKESSITLASLLALVACVVFVRPGKVLVRGAALVVILGCVGMQMVSRAYVAPALVLSVAAFLTWYAVGRARAVGGTRPIRAIAPVLAVVVVIGLPATVGLLGSGISTSEQSSLTSRIVTSIGVQSPLQHLQSLRSVRARTAGVGESGLMMEACVEAPDPGTPTMYCEALRLPAAIAAIVTRPMWPIDDFASLSPAWSRFGPAVQVDSLASAAWILLVLVLTFTHRTRSQPLAAAAAVYFITVLIGLALIEGNMGTWMRHRLMLLWPLCLLVALTGIQRRTARCTKGDTGPTHQ